MDEDSFLKGLLSFQRQFNEERSLIVPITSINRKAIAELKTETKELMSSLFAICRLHYMAMAPKLFNLVDLTFPLKEITPLSVTASLKVFKKPNHKDRYSFLIYYLVTNPEVFVQIVYFSLGRVSSGYVDHNSFTRDDSSFFCYNTFPSVFNFFLSKLDRKYALSFVTNMFRLHVFFHGNTISPQFSFLKDIVFSFILSTDPGRFYENSVTPLIATFSNSVIDKTIRYVVQNGVLTRVTYWNKCADFIEKLVKRMTVSVPLFPMASRQLITQLLSFDSDNTSYYSSIIIETIICLYLENFTHTDPEYFIHDLTKVVRCNLYRESINDPLLKPVAVAIKGRNFQFEGLLQGLALSGQMIAKGDGISDAIDITERMTIFTPRDLTLLFKSVTYFISFGKTQTMEPLSNAISGIEAPVLSSDEQFLLVRPWKSDTLLCDIELQNTGGFDEYVDLLNFFDFSQLKIENAKSLADTASMFYSSFSSVSQQLGLHHNSEHFKKSSDALSAIHLNKETLQSLSDRLSTALFFLSNEKKRHDTHWKSLVVSYISSRLLPCLITHYPIDFSFDHNDIFSPTKCYDTLFKNVTNRVASLNVPECHQFTMRRLFFFEFFDQIDIAFAFQMATKTNHITALLAKFIQNNYQIVDGLSPHKHFLLARAAEAFQQIKTVQKISNNFSVMLQAMNLLQLFEDQFVSLAVAISANPDIFGFSNFLGGYFKNDMILNLLMNEKERELMKKFRASLVPLIN